MARIAAKPTGKCNRVALPAGSDQTAGTTLAAAIATAASAPTVESDAKLQAERWIVRERGSGTRAVLENELTRLGWLPAQVLELQRPEAIKQAVKQGLGIGCLPLLAVQDELAAGQLLLLPNPLQLKRHLSLVLQPGYQSPLLQTFLSFLQQKPGLI